MEIEIQNKGTILPAILQSESIEQVEIRVKEIPDDHLDEAIKQAESFLAYRYDEKMQHALLILKARLGEKYKESVKHGGDRQTDKFIDEKQVTSEVTCFSIPKNTLRNYADLPSPEKTAEYSKSLINRGVKPTLKKIKEVYHVVEKTREVKENIKDLNEQEFRIDTTYKKDKSYACVVLDFPWQMGIEYDAGRFRGVGKYDTLSFSCLLYTSPSPRDS